MDLKLMPIKIEQKGSEKRMSFEPEEFYNIIKNHPDAYVSIVDKDGEVLRTFHTKPIWEGLFSNQRTD